MGPSYVYACLSHIKGGSCTAQEESACKSPIVTLKSNNPKWHLNCTTTATDPHLNMEALAVVLVEQTGNHNIGRYDTDIESLFDSHFKGSADNLHEYAFEDNFPIQSTQNATTIGDFMIKMDFKLARR